MNTQTIKKKLQTYYDTATPEQVLREFEALGVEFTDDGHWLWYWGWDTSDKTKHSEKLKFTNFNEMKTFSSRHSYSCQHFKPNYWSTYEFIEKD